MQHNTTKKPIARAKRKNKQKDRGHNREAERNKAEGAPESKRTEEWEGRSAATTSPKRHKANKEQIHTQTAKHIKFKNIFKHQKEHKQQEKDNRRTKKENGK